MLFTSPVLMLWLVGVCDPYTRDLVITYSMLKSTKQTHQSLAFEFLLHAINRIGVLSLLHKCLAI